MTKELRRSAPVVAVAAGALLLSATGGAVAADLITGEDIQNGSITSRDIRNYTLKTTDIAPPAAAALQGATGPAGPAGADGVSGWQRITTTIPVAAGATGSITATCTGGRRVLGASADWTSSYDHVGVRMGDTSATAYGQNATGGDDTLIVYAVCGFVS